MEIQIDKDLSIDNRSSFFFKIGELLMVFLPAALLLSLTRSWAGEDPIKTQSLVWAAYAIMLIMIWVGLKLRGKSWGEFGLTFESLSFKKALNVFGLSLVVFVLGVAAFVLGSILMASFTGIPESADYSKYNFLKDNLGLLMLTLGGVYVVSSFGEEVVFRAFLINRISEFGTSSKYTTALAVVLSSLFFGLAHYEWGPMGMVQTGFMGLAMGICYIKLNKRLWILVLAHVYMDTLLLVQMYMASN
tara:strand:- start:661 stop:1398 length:738 start_codon:yes stop_codon:yes gene_type:complete